GLPVRLEDLPRIAGPDPRTSLEPARAMVAADLGVAWNNAPEPPKELVGRAELLEDLSLDFADPEHSVTGLIGTEGEGKSSLARRWVDNLLADALSPQPDGVFWWSFHANPSGSGEPLGGTSRSRTCPAHEHRHELSLGPGGCEGSAGISRPLGFEKP
ncbi:MAG: hypothetical protein ABIK79_03260, partial [Chloroflexota bacterium]